MAAVRRLTDGVIMVWNSDSYGQGQSSRRSFGLPGGLGLVVVDGGRPSAVAALGGCCGEAVQGAFVDEVAFQREKNPRLCVESAGGRSRHG